jgi:outer membrane protein TolC
MRRALCIAILAALAPTAHAESPRRITFEQAVELSLAHSFDIRLAAEGVSEAKEKSSALRSRRLPSAHVEAVGTMFSEPYTLPFGDQVVTLYERETSTTSVRVVQPLTGLVYLSQLIGAAEHGTHAARANYDKARLDAAYSAADDYLQVLEARARADVARESVDEISAELEQSQKLQAADALTKVDVLRLQAALARAQQGVLRTHAALQVSLAHLRVVVGIEADTPIAVADDLPAAPPPLAMSLDDALAQARAARPELHAAREQVAAASKIVSSKRDEYLPELTAVASYTHTTGVQPFQKENTEFVGLQLSWQVWDWGGTRAEIRRAEHARSRARLASLAAADQVTLEVRRKWFESKAAFESLAAVQIQLASAEEAYRLQHVRFEAGAATTTDVLASETDVARARVDAALARYDYYLGLVALARAVGDMPRSRGPE